MDEQNMVNSWLWNKPETSTASSKTKKLIIVIVVLVVLGALGAAGYFYKQLSDLKKNPNKNALDETKMTIDAVSKLIVLPTGEQPTLATVTDPDKLKDQPFFAHAKTGYKVLIYTNAKKAILYNPIENKIVEVAPINIGNNTTVSGASSTPDKIGTPTKTTPTPGTK